MAVRVRRKYKDLSTMTGRDNDELAVHINLKVADWRRRFEVWAVERILACDPRSSVQGFYELLCAERMYLDRSLIVDQLRSRFIVLDRRCSRG